MSMMQRKVRRWHSDQEDDPLSGLVNLFDVWIVVVVALMLALAKTTSNLEAFSASRPNSLDEAAQISVPAEDSQSIPMPNHRTSEQELTGKGVRLGTAYRLESGEIVYTPE